MEVNSQPSTSIVCYSKETFVRDVVYDLDKEIHGEWMTVSRKKRSPKDQPKKDALSPNNSFEGLKQALAQSNQVLVMHPGVGSSSGERKETKKQANQKRRHQEQQSIASAQPVMGGLQTNKSKGIWQTTKGSISGSLPGSHFNPHQVEKVPVPSVTKVMECSSSGQKPTQTEVGMDKMNLDSGPPALLKK